MNVWNWFWCIMEYLLHLKTEGLSVSLLKVDLAAISAYHVLIDNKSVFAHNMVKKIIKGLPNLYPSVKGPLR